MTFFTPHLSALMRKKNYGERTKRCDLVQLELEPKEIFVFRWKLSIGKHSFIRYSKNFFKKTAFFSNNDKPPVFLVRY
jgi:hypothetical protein